MVNWFPQDKTPPLRKLERSGRSLRKGGHVEQVDVEDASLSVWRSGAAENAIVFIHGNSACKEVFYEQFNALSKTDISFLAVDLPGHGCSMNAVNPESAYCVSGYARILKQLLDQMRIHRPILAGWSLGGHIAIEMAGRGFDIAGLVLCGAPPSGPGLTEMLEAFTPSPEMDITTKKDASREELHAYAQSLYACMPEIPQHFFNAAWRTDGQARHIMGQRWVGGMEGCHQKTVVAGWRNPICVMHGTGEMFFSEDYLKTLEWRNLWRNKIHSIAGAGHAPFIEAPEAYNATLIDFAKDVFNAASNA